MNSEEREERRKIDSSEEALQVFAEWFKSEYIMEN